MYKINMGMQGAVSESHRKHITFIMGGCRHRPYIRNKTEKYDLYIGNTSAIIIVRMVI